MREVHICFRSSFQKKPASPIWRNTFGAKNGAQAKRRIEAYLTYARKQAKGAFRCVAGIPRRGARERVRGALPLKGAAVSLPLKGQAPYGRKVRQPLKELTPLTKIGFANTSIPLFNPTTKNEPPT